MKNIQITLQPLSLIVGAALLGIMLITTGAFAPQGTASARDVTATEDVNSFAPREAIRIASGDSYTVPEGKLFVPTSIASQTTGYVNDSVVVKVNGTLFCQLSSGWGQLQPLPSGPVFQGGNTLTLYTEDGTPGNLALYGYLMDA